MTVVATANVLCTLSPGAARQALRTVLDTGPDLVGLQEWYLSRAALLRETGSVGLVPPVGLRLGRRRPGPAAGYLWSTPVLGGCTVGVRVDRFELVGTRSRVVSGIGRADKPERWLGIEPPRVVTIGTYRDKLHPRVVSLLDYHLTPGVQARGRYRDDRPRLAARHRSEVRNLQQLVDDELALGRVVYALGDSNYDGLRLARLTSAWEGRPQEPGTLGPRRKVDDVHGPTSPSSVSLLGTGSDHKAVVATWATGDDRSSKT